MLFSKDASLGTLGGVARRPGGLDVLYCAAETVCSVRRDDAGGAATRLLAETDCCAAAHPESGCCEERGTTDRERELDAEQPRDLKLE